MSFKVMRMDKAILRRWVVKVLKFDSLSGRACGRVLSLFVNIHLWKIREDQADIGLKYVECSMQIDLVVDM